MRQAKAITITPGDRDILEGWIAHPRASSKLKLRASIVLCAADGKCNRDIAAELKTTPKTVSRWRARFASGGLFGIKSDAPRTGRPPTIDGDTLALVAWNTLIPDRLWTTRSIGRAMGVSKSSIHRIWNHIDELLDDDWQRRNHRAATAAAPRRPSDLPTYSEAQLARARRAYDTLNAFLTLSFSDFSLRLLDGGERSLQVYERAASAFERYEAAYGHLKGERAKRIGWLLVSISFGNCKRAEVPQALWDQLVQITDPEPTGIW